jgi:hypothetical protein
MSSRTLEVLLRIVEVLGTIVIATFAVLAFLRPSGTPVPTWAWRVLILAGLAVLAIGGRLIFHSWRPMTFLKSCVEPYDPKLEFSPKLRVELRNDSRRCVDIETSRWIEGKPLRHNSPWKTWQVYREGKWTPSPAGEAKLHAHPGEKVRTWMVFKGMSESELENARSNKWLGKLEIAANGRRFKIKL